ncbi:hypothetical protein Pcinc_005537 [Petrolisthes cinctipes]|uniref:Reverse transcriptase domain-containing protein n=1 Tax=Petrolisthes cinctipes TaxID=88211 RepID=A0AAE1GD57_PETCI|nr:hypothetical protein Pcinc_005537 [Petrolisthes cinctipes]
MKVSESATQADTLRQAVASILTHPSPKPLAEEQSSTNKGDGNSPRKRPRSHITTTDNSQLQQDHEKGKSNLPFSSSEDEDDDLPPAAHSASSMPSSQLSPSPPPYSPATYSVARSLSPSPIYSPTPILNPSQRTSEERCLAASPSAIQHPAPGSPMPPQPQPQTASTAAPAVIPAEPDSPPDPAAITYYAPPGAYSLKGLPKLSSFTELSFPNDPLFQLLTAPPAVTHESVCDLPLSSTYYKTPSVESLAPHHLLKKNTLKHLGNHTCLHVAYQSAEFFLEKNADLLTKDARVARMPPPRPPDLHTPTTGVKVCMVERQLETSNKVLATPLVTSELSPPKKTVTSERVLPPSDYPGTLLQQFSHRWSKAPCATLKMLRRGFHWKWPKEPPPLLFPKLKNVQPQLDLDLEIQLLLLKGAIYEVPYQPCLVSRIFLVPKSKGGNHLIIDLSSLNNHILTPYFHMHNHRSLADSLHPPAWMSTIDLQDTYLHVPIRQCLHKYLAFSFGSKLYFFRALPFGLNVAPHIFTCILRWLFTSYTCRESCHRLFRRLGHLGHVSRIDSKGCQHSDQPSEQPRLPNQRPKVPPPPSTDVPSQFLQNSHRCIHDFFPPKFKGGQPEQTFNHLNRVVTSKANRQMVTPSGAEDTGILPSPRSDNSSLVSNGALVQLNTEQVIRTDATQTRRSRKEWVACIREMDHLQFLRTVFSIQHDEDIASRLSADHASTTRQSQSNWKMFQQWLPADISDITEDVILRFLIYLDEMKQLSPHTTMNYRNALVFPLPLSFSINMSHRSFSLLARSQFLRRPPPAKKVPTWSINAALATFSWPEFNPPEASTEKLLLKALFLTALATANRASELASTIRKGIMVTNGQATLPVQRSFLFKNQNINHQSAPAITFLVLHTTSLCPWNALDAFLKRTAGEAHQGFIFVHPTSFKPLKAGRLSYWLVKSIKTADTSATSPAGRDVRKFGYSIAFPQQEDPATIMKNGFWQSPNGFVNKYLFSPGNTRVRNFVVGRTTL